MNNPTIYLSEKRLSRFFPFYILFDEQLEVLSIGPSLKKIFPACANGRIQDHFRLKRPHAPFEAGQHIAALFDQLVVLESLNAPAIVMRGQFEPLDETNQWLFAGTPWFPGVEALRAHALTINDFALHDSMIDLLHVLQLQQVANSDIREMLGTLQEQQKQLREAGKQAQELALFPLYNPFPLVRIDLKGNILTLNPAAEGLQNYQTEEGTFTTTAFWKHQLPHILDTGGDAAFEAMADGRRYVFTCRVLREAGFINIYARDITAEHEALQLARESVRVKDLFLANMSHEMRTPLNAVLGMGEQLRRSDLNQQQRFYLDTMLRSADHLLVVINEILDMARIEAGHLQLETIGFRPQEVLRHTIDVMQHRADEKGLRLELNLDPRLAPVLLGDPYRLHQVLLNLLSNAIQFTEKGWVHVSCRLADHDAGTQQLLISITDTGIGIDPAFLDKLFDKFQQEDKAIARKYGGTGLGMAITRDLVELMNGSIEVRSSKGMGTEVQVSLPFRIGADTDLPVSEVVPTDHRLLAGKHVLLVEDNEVNRLVALSVLQPLGIEVTPAVHGGEALDQLRQRSFDLVLMDLHMPVMDGLEATARIRQELRLDVPIVALTANAVKGEQERCLQAGMNGYVSKPFREADLLRALHAGFRDEAPASQAPLPSGKEYDLQPLLELLNGDRQQLQLILGVFIREMPADLAALESACEAGNVAEVAACAHKIKAPLQMLAMTAAFEAVIGLEQSGSAVMPRTVQKAAIEKIRTGVDGVITALKKEMEAAS